MAKELNANSKCSSEASEIFGYINREYRAGEKSLIFRFGIQAASQPLTL